MIKRFFKNKILRTLFLLTVLAGLLIPTNILGREKRISTVRAAGDLRVDWRVPEGDPIFEVNNLLPGQEEIRNVFVYNDSGAMMPIAVKGVKVSETKNLAKGLDITILDDDDVLYGPKTLEDFFKESGGIAGVPFEEIGPFDIVTFKVDFKDSAGDEFQGAGVVFDLVIGIGIELPKECEGIQFSGGPIFGTHRRDVLNGTKGNDLIIGFAGNDTINGKKGNDCIIGGSGNDIIHGHDGDDVIFGNEGKDRIDGNNGNDQIFGGAGNDEIKGGNGNDKIYGDDGYDSADGGKGSDSCQAEKKKKCEIS